MKNSVYAKISILLFMLLASKSYALEIQWDLSGLSQNEIHATKQITQEALELLPPSFKNHLNKKIYLSYANIDRYGDSSGNSIRISNKLKGHITAGRSRAVRTPTELSSKHPTVYDIALGTILHELAHQYDFHATHRLNPKKTECTSMAAESSPPLHCVWNQYKNNVSDNPQFLYSISWNKKEFKGQYLVSEDDSTARSPNPYEFKNPEEAFSVNFEFFLMDPQYKCRRPTAYRFLANHFQFEPFAQIQCAQRDQVYVTLNNSTFSGAIFESLPVDRIASIHYLLAGDGEAMMSKWGHSMIRLVICSPERKIISEKECINDIAHHRVVSYRAGVTDLSIDNVKGITGEYPSRLYILPLLNIINEYTKLEMRELLSYPLVFNRDQVKDFVTRAQEQNWGYRGKYYFSNNNCATETFNLIRSVAPENINFASREINTPKSLRDALLTSKLGVDSEKFQNRGSRYYWSSKKNDFQRHVDNVAKISGIQIKDVKNYIALPPQVRQQIYQRVLASKQNLASLYVLTDLMHERLNMIKNATILQVDQKKKNSDVLKTIKEALDQEAKIGSTYFSSTYGIPTNREIEITTSIIQKNIDELKSQARQIDKYAEEIALQVLGQDFIQDLESQSKNKENIKRTLIELRAQGS